MDPDVGTNLGVLYATLIIIIGTIVTEWPPRRIDEVFILASIATSLIVLRVFHLIYKIDPQVHRICSPIIDPIADRIYSLSNWL
jgi:hypothetical protein